MRIFVKVLAWILVLGGGYVAFRGAREYYDSKESQSVQALEWESQTLPGDEVQPSKRRTDSTTDRQRPAIAPGSSVARLLIPRLNSVLYVVEGVNDRDLRRGPGHMSGSALPGATGNCIIAGHRDTHFRVLKNISKGDEIVLESHDAKYRYKVTEVSVVTPDNTACLKPTSRGVLNLITCFPFEYVGTAPRRFIVHADLEPNTTHAGV